MVIIRHKRIDRGVRGGPGLAWGGSLLSVVGMSSWSPGWWSLGCDRDGPVGGHARQG
jgi:hypothetical protein